MRKFIFLILIATLLLFGVGNVYATPYNSIQFDGTETGIEGTYVDDYKGYLSLTEVWSGYYIGTFSGNDDEAGLESLASTYLGVAYNADIYEKIDYPDTTDTYLTIVYTDNYHGTWTLDSPYELGFYSVKAGPNFALYFVEPPQSSGNWSTIHLEVGATAQQPEISHLSVLAVEGTSVPEPTTLLLLGLGLIGLAGFRKR